MVGQILSKPEYIGHTVNFRSHKESYKDKGSVRNPQEEWLIFENTHEAIIDKETWELVQKLRKTPRRKDTLGEANPLTGLVFCADCGAKMYNHRFQGDLENGNYPYDAYECSAYKLASRNRADVCRSHYISTKAIRALLLETIQAASTYAITNQKEFLEKVRASSALRQKEAVKDSKRKLNKKRRRADELDIFIKKLYESFAIGRISDERFDSLLTEYETEQRTLRSEITESEKQVADFEASTANAEQFLALAKKYTDFSELTTPMINEFVDKILVHAPEKVDGDRVQEVEIYLNFIGYFAAPVPELTPEEEMRQEYLRKHRMQSRERYKALKEGTRKVGEPFRIVCKCCGKIFESKMSNAMFCDQNCRSKYYRQEAAKKRKRECTCENCGTVFTTDRNGVKYCCEACMKEAAYKRQKKRRAAKKSEQKLIEVS